MIINTVEAPLWTSVNTVPAQYPWLDEDIHCEVAVVGGGVSAAMCAYRFAEAGIDTVLLSADPIGYGGTAVSTGMMSVDGEDSLVRLVEEIGADRAMMAATLLRAAIDNIGALCASFNDDCGYRRMDVLRYTQDQDTAAMLRREYSLRLHNGMDVELLSADSASRQFTFPMEAGVYAKDAGAQVDPYRLAHALAAAARKAGARIYENTAVSTILEHEDNSRDLHCSTRRVIHAGYVIVAAGLETDRHCGGLDRLRTTYMVATDPIAEFSGWRGPCIIRRDGDARLYLTVTPDDRILIGGMDSALMDERGRLAGVLSMGSSARKRQEALSETLREMFPAIRDITPHYVFAAKDGCTEDGLPVIGRLPEKSGTAYALCCGDNGLLYAEIAGRLLLQQYRGDGDQELGLFSPNREWRIKH